jgi:hypothetical protein
LFQYLLRNLPALAPIDELLKIMKFEQTVIDGGEAGFVMVEQSLSGQDLNKEEMDEVKMPLLPT